MDASETSDWILSLIKKSNLNFSLSESPFSVSINIKKTFIKDKNGNPRPSNIPENFTSGYSTNIPSQSQYMSDHEPAVPAPHHKKSSFLISRTKPQDPVPEPTSPNIQHQLPSCPQIYIIKDRQISQHPQQHPPLHANHLPRHQESTPQHDLEFLSQPDFVPNIPVQNKFSCLASGNSANISIAHEISELNNNTPKDCEEATKSFKTEAGVVVDQDEAEFLVVNNKRLKQVTKRLNKELARVNMESRKRKIATMKEAKVEIKQWRKSLGQERSQKIKLEKKLALLMSSQAVPIDHSTLDRQLNSSKPVHDSEEASEDEAAFLETCSICVRPIPNYIPRYSSGLLWNPACSDCDDTFEHDDDDENPD